MKLRQCATFEPGLSFPARGDDGSIATRTYGIRISTNLEGHRHGTCHLRRQKNGRYVKLSDGDGESLQRVYYLGAHNWVATSQHFLSITPQVCQRPRGVVTVFVDGIGNCHLIRHEQERSRHGVPIPEEDAVMISLLHCKQTTIVLWVH